MRGSYQWLRRLALESKTTIFTTSTQTLPPPRLRRRSRSAINADFAAAALAKALKVRKFALVSDVPGILKDASDPATLFSTLHLADLATLREEGVISGGMLPKVESCADAIKSGVKKVHLVDGRMAHSLLLEIFTREGVGTEITE